MNIPTKIFWTLILLIIPIISLSMIGYQAFTWVNTIPVAGTVQSSTLSTTGGGKYNTVKGYETNVLFSNPPIEGKNGTSVYTPRSYTVGEEIDIRVNDSGIAFGSAFDVGSISFIAFDLAAFIIIWIIWRGAPAKPIPFASDNKKVKK